MSTPIRIGDLVACASKAFREQLGLALETGLYLVDRKRDGLVLFAASDRSAWVPKAMLKPVAADDPRLPPPPAWVVRVHRAVRLVEGIDLELESDDEGRREARIGCPSIDGVRFRELERILGDAAKGMRIAPGSMSRITVVFAASE